MVFGDALMESDTIFKRENQLVSADDILKALASGHQIKLLRCTVVGEMDINRLLDKEEKIDVSNLGIRVDGDLTTITVGMPLTFNNCTFEENVCFSSPWESNMRLQVVFKQDIVFNSSVFCGQGRFSDVEFKGLAGFDGCTFERVVTFRNVKFQSRAMFRTVFFNGYGLFNNSTFHKEGRFANSCFSKGANFTNVHFIGNTDFSGVYSKSKSVPVYESVRFGRRRYGEDVTFWRFIKQASQDAGLYRAAGEAFYNEMCAHFWRQFHGPNYSELSIPGKIRRGVFGLRLLPELIFGRLLFGYGERPVRVLIASVLIIGSCALFYSSDIARLSGRSVDVAGNMHFIDGLYFSVTTFTTLGFGDVFPERSHLLTRSVAMFEALSGAALMALFVVCLAKRFSRG